jgi:hypothetical protein
MPDSELSQPGDVLKLADERKASKKRAAKGK